ncbi:MAG: antitoxin MazE-like protein [Myxococcota bacterium]
MIGVRLDSEMERALDALARRQGRTRSDIVREALERYLEADELRAEARRQSLLVASDPAEEDAADFIEHAAAWPADP